MGEENSEVSKSNALEVQLILPKFDNSGNPINPEYFNNILLDFAEKVNGGFTVIPETYGCWLNEETGKLQCEENFVIETILNKNSEDFQNKIKNLEHLAESLRKDLGQWEILYTLDNDEVIEVKGKGLPESPESLKNIRVNIIPQFIR